MALLFIAQRQNNNWIPLAAMKYIAKFLDMPYIKVYEVATFTACIIYHQLELFYSSLHNNTMYD